MNTVDSLLNRGVEKIYPSKESLREILESGRKLRVYQGFDPTMPSLHLGNLVGILKLKQFQELGHEVIFLVGDFTGMIGDPTDKLAARKRLTRKQTRENCRNWKNQVQKILNFEGPNPVKFIFNSSWLDKINFDDLIEITSHFTVQQLLERDMFEKRLKKNVPIYLHEFLYPVAQAIDCVEMNVDIEIGGTDQTFNMLFGRSLLAAVKGKEKIVMTLKLLVNEKGEKIGKTTGNAIFLDTPADNLYGEIMALSDDFIYPGIELLTSIPLANLSQNIKKDPLKWKKNLAFEITKLLHGKDIANSVARKFENIVQKKQLPSDIPLSPKPIKAGIYKISQVPYLIGISVSISQTKRLISQGGLKFQNQTIKNPNLTVRINGGETIQVGKVGKGKIFKIKTK